jgi:DNA invertase Pin-like site-specific DNA recombinase
MDFFAPRKEPLAVRKIGYARVSTEDQNLDLQIHALRQDGCVDLFEEKITGTSQSRPVLNAALESLKAGDTLVVWKLDRLGRSLQHLIEILQSLEARDVGFRSISDSIDTNSAGGRLLFHILGALAEFESSLISERTKAGLQAARRKGKTLGRPKCMDGAQIEEAPCIG